jgi:copper chaperone CopZ
MDDDDWTITEVKGWIEVTVSWPEGEKAITFYDPSRLTQEIRDGIAGHGYFAESAVVVVPTVTREAIEAAVAQMAESGFAELR